MRFKVLSTILFLLLFSLAPWGQAAFGQKKPNEFPLNTNPNNSNFEFYSQKNGVSERSDFDFVRKGMLPDVKLVPIVYVPTASGNSSNNGDFVKDPNGDTWFIDGAGEAFMLTGNTEGLGRMDSMVLIQDSILVAFDADGSELFRDTLAAGGILTEVDGSVTNELAAFTSAASAPGSPKVGDIWHKSTTDSVFIRTASAWTFLARRTGFSDITLQSDDGNTIIEEGETVQIVGDGTLETHTIGAGIEVALPDGAVTSAKIEDLTLAWNDLSQPVRDSITATSSRGEIIPIPPGFPYNLPFDIIRAATDSFIIDPSFNLQTYANVTATDTFFVNVNVGASGTGQSWVQAYKGLDEAITAANSSGTAKQIYIAKGHYYKQHSWNAVVPTVSLKIIGDLAQGTGAAPYLTTDVRDLASAFTNVSNYWWAILTTSVDGVYDAFIADAFGDASTLTKRTSIAGVNSNASSWYWSGDTIYVRTADSRSPDAFLRYYDNATNVVIDDDGTTTYLKNLEMRGKGIAAASATSAGGTKLLVEDCGAKELKGYAISAGGLEIMVFGGEWAKSDSVDLLNYHASNGIAPTVVEYNVTAYNSAEQFTTCGNCQASSIHDDGKIIRINGDYSFASGQNIADVSGADGWILGTNSHDSRTDIGYYFGSAGTPANYFLLDATSGGNTTDIAAEADAAVQYRNFTPTPPVTSGAGTFTAHYTYNSDSDITGDLDMQGNDIQNVGDLEATTFDTRDTALVHAWSFKAYDANIFVGKNIKGVGLDATSWGNSFFGNGAGRLAQGVMVRNIFAGNRSGENANGADFNAFVGEEAAAGALTGEYNAGLGYLNMSIATSANYNTTAGALAGLNLTTGDENTLVGFEAGGYANVSKVTAVGVDAAASNTADGITAIGHWALRINNGLRNTATGFEALRLQTSGDDNTSVGNEAMESNTTGDESTAIGSQSQQNGLTGIRNTSVGYRSLRLNTAGNGNTAVGKEAILQGTGSDNTGVGKEVLFDLTTGTHNVVAGSVGGARLTTATNFIGLGASTGLPAAQKVDIQNAFVVGREAYATQNGYMVFGNVSYPYTHAFFGEGELSASPGDFTISGTNAGGTNVAGGNMYYSPGRSTGNLNSGDHYFQTSPAGAGGGSLNALVTDAVIRKGGIVDAVSGFRVNNTGSGFLKWDGAKYAPGVEDDGSATNEGALSVGAATTNSSQIITNTSGDGGVILKTLTTNILTEAVDSIKLALGSGSFSGAATIANTTRTDTLLNGGTAYGHFQRMGEIVNFSVRFEVGLSADTTSNIVYVSPPYASNFDTPASDVVAESGVAAQGVYGGNPIKIERVLAFADDTGDRIAIAYTVDRQGATYPANRVYVTASGHYLMK